MPRRQTLFVPGLYYHIYNRGNNRQSIFFQPENYFYFLRNVKKYIVPLAKVAVYCLMPTHYHILLRVEPKTSEFLENSEVSTISNAMMRLSVSYTKAINKRFSRFGSLFQGQFQAKPIETYSHLLNLCVYIHANPVKDGLIALPEDWIYSNYLEWLGQREGMLVDREFIQEHFGSPAEYQTLVMEYIKTRYLPDDVRKYLQSLED
ncbi:MAG TPA: transposase [Anaerolineales bacterium]|nr:transposase [Anaerolineales bacterium]